MTAAASSDVPDDLRREFWLLVGLLNVALFGIALGLLLLWFQRGWTAGVAALAIGLGASGAALSRYRRVRNG